MPTPKLSRREAERTIAKVEEALVAGHRPLGVAGSGKGAIATTAAALETSPSTIHNRLESAKAYYDLAPDWNLWVDPNYREFIAIHKAAPRPRVRVKAETDTRPEGPKYRVLGIGDTHDSPHIPDKARFSWIGKYAAERRIPYIRAIGDVSTVDSCSQFDDYGSIEGRLKPSFDQDVESLEAALAALVKEFPDDYDPDRLVTLGNHENRAYQWEDTHPEVEGMFALRLEQAFARARFQVVPYGEWSFLGGVGFIHFPMTLMGRPFGGEHPENQIANKAVFSLVIGHTHKAKVLSVPKIGPQARITILNLGSALPHGHIEPYALKSTTGWGYGIYDFTIQGGDIHGVKSVSMLELEETYG